MWNVYGKIKQVTKGSVVTTFTYDASGNRISKIVNGKETWYIRDAGGNVMAVYNIGYGSMNGGAVTLSEQNLYGSSRLGIYKPKIKLSGVLNIDLGTPLTGLNSTGYKIGFERGRKNFELVNHLGNVLVTISDKKIGVDANSDGVIDYYNADVVTANDYYPFGQTMPGRTYGTLGRYTFNGKELDQETGYQDYGMRMYDITGRFISVDPITKQYPELSPYQFASNRPIDGIDLDGLEYVKPIPKFGYSHNVSDIPKGFDNAFIGLANGFVGLWNSGVDTYKSLRKGTYVQDVTDGAKQFGSGIKQTVTNSVNYSLHTPVSKQFTDVFSNAENIELGVNLYIGLKSLPTGNKGNLLSPSVAGNATNDAVDIYNGKFGQPNHSNDFSIGGQKALGVKSIDQAVVNLKNGTWTAAKLPIDYVVRDGQVYYLNTRSIATLTEAGIPKSKWVLQNQTGVKMFEDNLTKNLDGSSGYTEVTNRQTGKKTKL